MFRKIALAALAAAVIAPAFTPVAAQASDNVWNVGGDQVVRYQDLDLAKPADQQRLIDRIETASERACRDVRPFRDRDTCVEMSVKTAIASLPLNERPVIRTAMSMRQGGQLTSR